MPSLDHILATRRELVTQKQRTSSVLVSLLFHVSLVLAAWLVPDLLAKPPEKIDYVPVMVVSPALLGAEQPPPPPPPRTEPKPPEPAPPPPPPPPEPEPEKPPEPPDDRPVLVDEKKPEPKPVQPEPKPPPPEPKPEPKPAPPPPPPPPPAPVAPPKREGSPFGSPLGAASSRATVGVEDPNFTYGYYLDRIVAVISSNWVRPPVGSEIKQAVLYFRIQRDGTVTALRLAEPSGATVFDQAAVRAVEASSPLPPLPKGYQRDYLGINLIVK